MACAQVVVANVGQDRARLVTPIRTGREQVRRLLLSSAAAALTPAARGTWPLVPTQADPSERSLCGLLETRRRVRLGQFSRTERRCAMDAS